VAKPLRRTESGAWTVAHGVTREHTDAWRSSEIDPMAIGEKKLHA